MRRAGNLLAWGLLLALIPAPCRAEGRLVRVEPVVAEGQLQCRLLTAGLPGEKQLQSMQSGLEAAVELNLALVDEGERLLAGRTVSLRMAFDLWDEVFSVRADGRERRFTDVADLRAYLAELGGLQVAPTDLMAPAGRYRIQVDMVVHAVAPDERQRVEDVIVGDGRPRREGEDQQEASVSLGRLIRVFYKGGGEARAGSELASAWFRGREVHR